MNKKSFAVFGLGRFGSTVAVELAKCGADVLAVDRNEEKVREISDKVTYAVKCDVCETEAMEELGLDNMDGVVIAITEDFNASVMATILAKEAGVPYIIVKSKDSLHTKVLKKVGADKVIVPEKETGVRIARGMMAGGVLDFFELSDRIRMIEITIRKEWIGKSLRELNLRKKHKINIVAIRNGSELEIVPDPDWPLTADVSLIVMVDRNEMSKLLV